MASPLTDGLKLIQKQFASFFFFEFEHVHTTGFNIEMGYVRRRGWMMSSQTPYQESNVVVFSLYFP